MVDVYAPCIDKKLLKTGGKTFEGIMAALKVEKNIDEFLSDLDFSQGELAFDPEMEDRDVSDQRSISSHIGVCELN